MKASTIILGLTIMLVSFTQAYSQEKVSSETKNGLKKTTFKTKNGDVTVFLPDNLHAGDVISGTVIAEPQGKNEKQILKNKNILNGMVIELEDKDNPVEKDKLNWELPKIIKEDISYLLLKDQNGKELARTPIPLFESPRVTFNPEELSELDFSIPKYFRAGQAEMIPGAFDGDFMNTEIRINNIETKILAESPEGIFFETPENLEGVFDIEIVENDFSLTEEVNILTLNLSADKLNLAKGDKTNVNIEVAGLEGIENDIPLSISNLTPNNINMEGGNQQQIIIQADEIDENGIYRMNTAVTALMAGGFTVMVNLEQPENNFSKIISPADGEEIQTTTPEFKWDTYGFPEKVNHTLKLFAFQEGDPLCQSKEDLLDKEPVFVAENLGESTFNFPEKSALDLEKNYGFVWLVETYNGITGDLINDSDPSTFYSVSTKKCRCSSAYSGKVYANLINAENGVEGYVELSSNPSIIYLPPGPLALNFVKANLNCGRCSSANCSVSNITYNPSRPQITPNNTTQTLNVTVSWDCIADDCLSERCTYTYKLKYRKARQKCSCGDVKVTTTIRNVNPQNANNLGSSSTITKHCPVGSSSGQRLNLSGNLRFDNRDEIEIRISGIEVKCWCGSGQCDTSPTNSSDVREGENVSIDFGENDPDASNDNFNLVRTRNTNNGWQTNGDYVIHAQIRNADKNVHSIYQDFIIKYNCEHDECSNKYCTKNFRIYLGHF